MAEHLCTNHEDELLKRIQRLQKKLEIYEQLAEKVRKATVIDKTVYGDDHDTDWLSIDRDDYAEIMMILSKLDLWKPWHNTFQPRITK